MRTDVIYVVGHTAQDRVDNRLLCVAAYHLVAMELLNPFEVDDWYDTDQEIGVLGDIDRLGDDCSMQPLIEEHTPLREGGSFDGACNVRS